MSDQDKLEFVERRICIGMITSTEYIQRVILFWRADLLATKWSRLVCQWSLEYYDKYKHSPGQDIESLYERNKAELDPDTQDAMGAFLRGLSNEYKQEYDRYDEEGRQIFNVEYLIDQTKEYFQQQNLIRHQEEIAQRIDRGELQEGEAAAFTFAPAYVDHTTYIEPFSDMAGPALRAAFTARQAPLIRYPSAIGQFWNDEMTREAFVAIMAAEKKGKSWILMDAAIRAARQGCNTVLFQAGDMTENQMLRRIAIYAAQRSDQERYCKNIWMPILDCKRHQQDKCEDSRRQKQYYPDPILETSSPMYDDLIMAAKTFRKHSPCRNCPAIRGSVWLQKQKDAQPLTKEEVEREMRGFQQKHVKGRLRLSTHANGTLSVTVMKALLDLWERTEHFIPDAIIVDYADILAPCPDFARMEFRHQENQKWQRLRNLSQERHSL
ncbi:hypothetical protein LCGC14_2697500, partial [marine sediment metagenome]